MNCPTCKKNLIKIYEKGLGCFPCPYGVVGNNWEYRVFMVGHCFKCNSDWQWQDIDYMGEWYETDPTPAFKINGEWACSY